METVYNRIVEVFEDHPEVFTERQVPAPRMIDIHLGQPDDPEGWEVLCPAIFIGWNKQPAADGNSEVLTLDFHFLQEPGMQTENFSPTIQEGLEYLRFIKACKYLLNNLRADNTTPLRWAGERQAITQFFRYHIVTYTCNIDMDNESIHDPKYSPGSIESINIARGKIKPKIDKRPVPDIDIYKS